MRHSRRLTRLRMHSRRAYDKMGAVKPGTLDDFRATFEFYVGRTPSTEECRSAMALSDVASRTTLDPLILGTILDAKALDQRAKLPAEVKAVIEAGLDQIR